ncbi:acetoacetate-CoA ligase [Fusarium oxysporum f. sp. lycopersici 4287]|uniref:Acetoacetate-CoA ligase n=2 Tax=Fusarium oxysporum TaxID=5507 RepID=A0A0J9VSS8_FUSO4|nr:acetoacetate-CoA ligase [Fusarium oxysporum f. sp. lycopersici 4287]XP_018253517.1 acetoacetate-CoA ligase [Fusarium oxysporum f. sp. lycopersici 4287]EWZ77404.1 acetoacetate-CoA ligase [Fusarium oxysporum f. sp. lycopersici MN25]KAJ9413114.1 acetoacetate-CoA ligase [Fusarium oxysporum]KNB13913.1 acetoacetate-CoA ligase [Fusarium oxysporum f. sp. lycopersici 4287]KNB15472.1 acetoacetate-CoA ligase [Fusarium oxysporum f. sp. lycopersici 4287]
MLAAATIGAVWTAISPENGVAAALDRFEQVEPTVLFVDDGMIYNEKQWSSLDKTMKIVDRLRFKGLKLIITIKKINEDRMMDNLKLMGIETREYDNFLESSSDAPIDFEQLPSSHPLYVLFSSGTTGLPKAIVHSALGTLIQNKKSHLLHCSMDLTSRILYYTTTSWMMWHWSVAALACGASLVLYTGSPFRPHGYLSIPKLLEKFQVTHFGTSAAYLMTLEAHDIRTNQEVCLSHLEAIYSTASPLPSSTFSFIYNTFPERINLGSISGGTDIISNFGEPCPLLPVHAGEIQCIGLGLAVSIADSLTGRLLYDEDGELVCLKPFPSQPLNFWGPDGEAKYRSAYFERFDGVWHHGDFARINSSTGGLVVLGRSDGVLNPSGVRFGSAEIYSLLSRFFATEIDEALCVSRVKDDIPNEVVCLFVVMHGGQKLGNDLIERIKTCIRKELSPRHVPGVIEECKAGIPKTNNGKKIEIAVKRIMSGTDVGPNASVANPEALEWFRDWAAEN